MPRHRDRWKAPSRATPMAVDWDHVAVGRPERAYELLRRSIVRNQIDADAVRAFDALTGGAEVVEEATELVDRLGRRRDTDTLVELHRLLMSLPPDAELLIGALRRQFGAATRKATEQPRIRSRIYAWPMTTAILAADVAHRSTGDPRLIDLMSQAATTMLDHRDPETERRDDIRDRPSNGWVGAGLWRSRRAGRRDEFTTTISVTGRIALGLATVAERVGDHDDDLTRRIVECLPAALEDLDHEYVDLGDGRGLYRRPLVDEPEPVNHLASAGEAMLALAQLTGDRAWRDRADAMARHLEAALLPQPSGGVAWHYAPLPDDPRSGKPEAFWKARITARFVAACARNDIVFDRTTTEAIASTLATNVLRPDGTIGATLFDDGPLLSDHAGQAHKPFASIIAMYAIAEERTDLMDRIEGLVATRPQAGGWFGEAMSSLGYAARLARTTEFPSRDRLGFDTASTGRGDDTMGRQGGAAP